MSMNLPIEEITHLAHRESLRMKHYYIGVEHLFIALLEINDSIASRLLEQQGLSTDYTINKIRAKLGKGSNTRQWTGMPKTRRAQRILKQAEQRAHQNDNDYVTERDLLTEILLEDTCLPIMVLIRLGVDTEQMAKEAQKARSISGMPSLINIEYAADLPRESRPDVNQEMVLRQMFNTYSRIRVDRCLSGGYTSASLYIVTPFQLNDRADSAVAVKIDNAERILEEANRYEKYVKNTLPLLTARIEEKPTVPDGSDLAGIKYTLITPHQATVPRDLRALTQEWSPSQISEWLNNILFNSIKKHWWGQADKYDFQVWQEYDVLLPPLLTLEIFNSKTTPHSAYFIKSNNIHPRLHNIDNADIVILERFTVRKVNRKKKTVQLALQTNTTSEMAYKIEIQNVDFTNNAFFTGEVVEHIAGRVYNTRNHELTSALRNLNPDFGVNDEYIPYSLDHQERFRNPLLNYEYVEELFVHGRASYIHGDLHMGNIMIGPSESAFLIDFARTREGHTIFDWVCLEISFLSELVIPITNGTWDDAREVIYYLDYLNHNLDLPATQSPLTSAMMPIKQIRLIAQQCLAHQNDWKEYFASMSISALRAIMWDTMSIEARRLMFLVAGLSMHHLREKSDNPDSQTVSETTEMQSNDTTEMQTDDN